MDTGLFISTILTVAILSAIVVAANVADKRRDPRLHRWVMGVLLLMNLMLMLWYGFLPLILEPDETDRGALIGSFALSAVLGVVSTAALFQPVRERLTRVLPARHTTTHDSGQLSSESGPSGEALFPQMLGYYTATARPDNPPAAQADAGEASARGFDPRSTVHAVALVFCLYLLGTQFLSFVLGGGLEGVAEGFAEGLTTWDLVLNGLPLFIIPVLGVGWGVRRNLRQTLDRLGIGPLTAQGLGVAVGMAVALLILVSIVGSTWQLLTPPETFEEQTQASDALAESVTTI